MIFTHDKEFKRTYNIRVKSWIETQGDEFKKYIVD